MVHRHPTVGLLGGNSYFAQLPAQSVCMCACSGGQEFNTPFYFCHVVHMQCVVSLGHGMCRTVWVTRVTNARGQSLRKSLKFSYQNCSKFQW